MKKRIFFSALIGGAIGAVATIIFLVILNGKAPMETKDLLSFVLSTVSIVIAAITVLGAVVLVMTWNDIDERTGKIVGKYEEQAKQGINAYKNEKEVEIERNVKERQESLNNAGNQYMSMGETMKRGMKFQASAVTIAMAINVALWYLIIRSVNKKLKDLPK